MEISFGMHVFLSVELFFRSAICFELEGLELLMPLRRRSDPVSKKKKKEAHI